MTNTEIDHLVTEKILGWTVEMEKDTFGYDSIPIVRDERGQRAWYDENWSPTHHLLQAWRVLRTFSLPEWEWSITNSHEGFLVRISYQSMEVADEVDTNVCLAICLACLRARGIEI